MRPVILITPSTQRHGVEFSDASISLANRYPKAILAAGGVPWIMPCLPDRNLVAEAVRRCDGVMLTGGDDIQPKLYTSRLSQQLRKTVCATAPERDLFELMLIQETLRRRKPLLAICRGHQILNVALGGTLVVDISTEFPAALKHNRPDRKSQLVHSVAVQPGSLLARATGRTRLGVNSTHHQAVKQIAKPFRATALSEDGIIEAMELNGVGPPVSPFLISVQFHPERLFDRHEEFLSLFNHFTRACGKPG